ncbi:SRPBCC family protein [Nocardioides sp. AN3]
MGSPFAITRSLVIDAPQERLHELIDDFHQWRAWSPWEDLDPDLQRTYEGPESGVGARYLWKGNRRAGSGSMEITGVAPDRVDVRLVFTAPWQADNKVSLVFTPAQERGTDVTWTMTGEHVGGVRGLVMRLMPLDKMVGRDFEKGLARLKAVAEK